MKSRRTRYKPGDDATTYTPAVRDWVYYQTAAIEHLKTRFRLLNPGMFTELSDERLWVDPDEIWNPAYGCSLEFSANYITLVVTEGDKHMRYDVEWSLYRARSLQEFIDVLHGMAIEECEQQLEQRALWERQRAAEAAQKTQQRSDWEAREKLNQVVNQLGAEKALEVLSKVPPSGGKAKK